MQEGLIAACEAEDRYIGANTYVLRQTQREYATKFSTYLHRVLQSRYNDGFHKKLNQEKRRTAPLLEIDAPINADTTASTADLIQDQSVEVQAEHCFQLAHQFVRLCGALTGDAIEFLIGGLLGGVVTVGLRATATVAVLTEVRHVIERLGLTYDELLGLTKSAKARQIALTMLAGGVMIVSGLDMQARVLECIECRGQFALEDVKGGRFHAETMTCGKCYRRMQGLEPAISCFGKLKTDEHQGYSEKDIECRLHCMDRKACKQHLNKRGDTNMTADKQAVESAEDFIEDVVFDEVTAPAVKKLKKSKSNGKANGLHVAAKKSAAKPATKKIAAKSAKKAVKSAAKPVKVVTEVSADSLTGKLFEMLAKGTTRQEMAKKTNWNDHSVRGFLSGAPKRYGVTIKSTKNEKSKGEQGVFDKLTYKLVGKGPTVAAKKK